MLEWASIILTVLLSSYVIIVSTKKKNKLSCTVGKMASMTNSMMASVTIGTVLGIMFRSSDLSIPTIISIMIGMSIGFLTGNPISPMAALEGITAGIMGGMMGAMLGMMLQTTYMELMMYFLDVIYVLIMILLLKIIDKEANKQDEDIKSYKTI